MAEVMAKAPIETRIPRMEKTLAALHFPLDERYAASFPSSLSFLARVAPTIERTNMTMQRTIKTILRVLNASTWEAVTSISPMISSKNCTDNVKGQKPYCSTKKMPKMKINEAIMAAKRITKAMQGKIRAATNCKTTFEKMMRSKTTATAIKTNTEIRQIFAITLDSDFGFWFFMMWLMLHKRLTNV